MASNSSAAPRASAVLITPIRSTEARSPDAPSSSTSSTGGAAATRNGARWKVVAGRRRATAAQRTVSRAPQTRARRMSVQAMICVVISASTVFVRRSSRHSRTFDSRIHPCPVGPCPRTLGDRERCEGPGAAGRPTPVPTCGSTTPAYTRRARRRHVHHRGNAIR